MFRRSVASPARRAIRQARSVSCSVRLGGRSAVTPSGWTRTSAEHPAEIGDRRLARHHRPTRLARRHGHPGQVSAGHPRDGRPGPLPLHRGGRRDERRPHRFTRVLRSDYHARGVSASVVILGAIRDVGQGQRMLDESGMKASGFLPRRSRSPRRWPRR
jgi:hypothetical protein